VCVCVCVFCMHVYVHACIRACVYVTACACGMHGANTHCYNLLLGQQVSFFEIYMEKIRDLLDG